jgi:outer membrane lipoprotein-sorting protein
MTEVRDRELGSALRELEVPEHYEGFDTELRSRLGRRPRRVWALAAAAVLVVIAATLALALPRESDVASAAEVREAIRDGLASAKSLSGVFVNREAGGENRWSFLVTRSGSFRIDSRKHGTHLVYDAGRNVEYYSDGPNFVRRLGLAPGAPDSDAAEWVLQRGLGSVVAVYAAAGDPEVAETEHAGRSAWLLHTGTGNEGDLRRLTVDQETGIPVRDTLFHKGRLVSEWRIESLRVNDGSAGQFTIEPVRKQEVVQYDMGFRRVDLEDVEAAVGYEPLVPRSLPNGFELNEVAVAEKSRPTGDEQRQNPESREVVSLAYRSGFDEIVITTRLTGADRARWGDPLLGSSLTTRKGETVTLDDGALEGERGELLIDPNSVPHIWVVTDDLVVTIAGNLDRDELLEIAESLARSS